VDLKFIPKMVAEIHAYFFFNFSVAEIFQEQNGTILSSFILLTRCG